MNWDWNRVAYIFFVLAVFSALVKVGGMTLADSSPMKPRIASASTATTDPEPPWYMGSFLELEDDRGFLGEPSTETAGGGASPETPDTTEGANVASGGSGASSEAPVFYRPSKGTGPVCGNLSGASENSRVVFPLARTYFGSYSDTWGAPRPQGGHEGTDLMVPAGTPEYAMTDGTVVAVSGANENGWNTLGGYTVMIEAESTVGPIKAGDLFYYAHLESPSELPIGSKVQAGQVVGRAGDTGQGPEVTTGLFPAHLHLGWYDGSGGRTEVESGAMNPYPLLEWLNGNGGSVSGGSDASYCEAPQTDGPRPSTGEDDWPTPANSGERPDLDTGSDHARPSPAVVQQRPDRDNRDTPRNDLPEEPSEVHIGTPGTGDDDAADEGGDFVGEIPEDGPGDGSGDDPEIGPGDPADGDGDLPGIVGRIIDDGRGSGSADDLARWRERIRAILPDLLRDRREPQPDEGKDDGGDEGKRNGGDDRKVPPGDKDERPRNDDPKPDDPKPDEEPADGGSTDEGQPDNDGASGEDQPEGDTPDDDGGTDAGEETEGTEGEDPAQEGEGSATPPG